jgi:glycosyltransferase involved in cell wall biosynthesis
MKISVIITTFDQPGHLDLTLHGYSVQDDANFEIVIADDGSDGRTREVVERHKRSDSNSIRHVWQENLGFRKTVILNKAIGVCEGEYLLFTDGDCVPKPNLVRAHRLFSEPGCYIAGAYNRLPKYTTERVTVESVRTGTLFRPSWLIANGYLPTRGFVRLFMNERVGLFLDRFGEAGFGRFPGGNSSCFRADALAVGGFNESMTYGGEDREFGTRLCNLGVRPKRLKNASFAFHLDHDRPYLNKAELARNLAILRRTEAEGKTNVAGDQT